MFTRHKRSLLRLTDTTQQQRRLAFTLTRDGLDDVLDDLDLSDTSTSDDEQRETTFDDHQTGPDDERYEDADEVAADSQAKQLPVEGAVAGLEQAATAGPKQNKSRRHMPKRIRKKVCPCVKIHEDTLLMLFPSTRSTPTV